MYITHLFSGAPRVGEFNVGKGVLPMCFLYPPLPQLLHCQPKGNVQEEDGDISQVFSAFLSPLFILPVYMVKRQCRGGIPQVLPLTYTSPLFAFPVYIVKRVWGRMEAFHACSLPIRCNEQPTKSIQHNKCPWGGEMLCMLV